jgi:uncharacterized protein YabN with tetrapyrrole methylase and pyrophosphatase domain
MFESLTISLLWAACTWTVANIILGVMYAFNEVNTVLENKLIKRLDEIVHRVRVEHEDEVYYWYDQDDRKFLAQGRTTEEIIDVIKKRFPEHIFYFEESNHLICAKHDWEPVEARSSDKS